MASNINTTNIDVTYPVAGQDNDSQGFRDNFFNANDNFGHAKTEIEALQNLLSLDSVPTAAVGVSGDKKGMLAYDATYMYLCTADYSGAAIWIRSALTAW